MHRTRQTGTLFRIICCELCFQNVCGADPGPNIIAFIFPRCLRALQKWPAIHFLVVTPDKPSPSRHCISLLLGMSEKTNVFFAGNQAGPSVNFMPSASFLIFSPGTTSDPSSWAIAGMALRTNTNPERRQSVLCHV